MKRPAHLRFPARRPLRTTAAMVAGTAALLLATAVGTPATAAPTWSAYTTDRMLGSPVFGPDGNYWALDKDPLNGGIGIVRLGLDGTQTLVPLPPGIDASVSQLAVGDDGALWFTLTPPELVANPDTGIGRLAPDGSTITTFLFPTERYPAGITAGPDGNLWWIEQPPGLPTTVAIAPYADPLAATRFDLPADSIVYQLVAGPDGNVWATDQVRDVVYRITPAQGVTEFPLGADTDPNGITVGPDGALWIAERAGNRLVRVAVDGSVTECPPLPGDVPLDPAWITAGSDDGLWFGYGGFYQPGDPVVATGVGRATTDCTVELFALPGVTTNGFTYATAGDDTIGYISNLGPAYQFGFTDLPIPAEPLTPAAEPNPPAPPAAPVVAAPPQVG